MNSSLSVDAVPVEVVRLEKPVPEVLLAHLGRHVLKVLLLHSRVRLEDRVDDVDRQVVLDAVGAVRLRLDVGEEGAGHAHVLATPATAAVTRSLQME